MAKLTNAYYVERRRLGRIGQMRSALEIARSRGATHVMFPSANSLTFTAYRPRGRAWDWCTFRQQDSGAFTTSDQWYTVDRLPIDADDLVKVIAEEEQIAGHRKRSRCISANLHANRTRL